MMYCFYSFCTVCVFLFCAEHYEYIAENIIVGLSPLSSLHLNKEGAKVYKDGDGWGR